MPGTQLSLLVDRRHVLSPQDCPGEGGREGGREGQKECRKGEGGRVHAV